MILVGDALQILRKMDSNSVHCVMTSPPYCGLRDYGVEGQLGLEKTPQEYVAKMVEIFREVRRVLRKDGTLWLNLGDCYATGAGNVGSHPGGGAQGERWGVRGPTKQPNRMPLPGFKAKDLIGIPWRVALALQDDGWYLRSDIIWSKTNPMPSSVGDRPSLSHEYVFLLSKSRKYFYDREAVKQPATGTARPRGKHGTNRKIAEGHEIAPRATAGIEGPNSRMNISRDVAHANRAVRRKKETFNRQGNQYAPVIAGLVESRGLRTVWTFGTQAYKEDHFATFPEKLVSPRILAGTSERGCCGVCGAPWRRIVEVVYTNEANRSTNGPRSKENRHKAFGSAGFDTRYRRCTRTVGWRPFCECLDTLFVSADPKPALVLDPFAGAGTTGVVCKKLGRQFAGIELNAEYAALAERRIESTEVIPDDK